MPTVPKEVGSDATKFTHRERLLELSLGGGGKIHKSGKKIQTGFIGEKHSDRAGLKEHKILH